MTTGDSALVLVTGAYGFIGAAYCAHLAAHEVPYLGVVRALAPGESRPQIVAVGDFVAANWDDLFAHNPFSHVVHLAARAHRTRDDAEDPAAEYRAANVRVTDRLLAASRLARVRHFVFASTVKVHGESTPSGATLCETDPLAPADDYARSKVVAEAHVRRYGRELGLPVTILRLPLVYGPGVKANFAALVSAVRAGRVLPLGAILNRRSLLGVDNLVSALEAVRCQSGPADSIYFVSDGIDVSTPELVRAIAAAYRVPARLWGVPTSLLAVAGWLTGQRDAVGRLTASFAIDDARIRRSLGWKPPFTLAAQLARMASVT